MRFITDVVTHLFLFIKYSTANGFSQWLRGKESACNAGDVVLIPGWRRSPGGGNGSSLQYSCLGNPIDRGAWWATVPGIAKSQTRLSTYCKWVHSTFKKHHT